MSAFNGSMNLLRGAVRTQIIPRSSISTKPAKHHISAGEQGFALTTMFIAILGPSGWILSHLEEYKKR